jgi:hypothetical protein
MTLPESNAPLLVRTAFSDDDSWRLLCAETETPSSEGFLSDAQPVSDGEFGGATWETVKAAVPRTKYSSRVVLIADEITLASPDHPVLVVDTLDFEGELLEPFRCVSENLAEVVLNLNISNMDWEDFADHAPDRVFRGF